MSAIGPLRSCGFSGLHRLLAVLSAQLFIDLSENLKTEPRDPLKGTSKNPVLSQRQGVQNPRAQKNVGLAFI